MKVITYCIHILLPFLDVYAPFELAGNSYQSSCPAPDRRFGNCKLLEKCKYVNEIVRSSPVTAREYLDKDECQFFNHKTVCCLSNQCIVNRPNTVSRGINENLYSHYHGNEYEVRYDRYFESLLPTKECGVSMSSRIVNGEEVELGQFPWMVLLEYADRPEKPRCGGVLISKRYVLTAAHCICKIPKFEVTGVRLGEHEINTSPDCLKDEYGIPTKDCADPELSVRVTKIIVHEDYSLPGLYHNDIALLRLIKDIKFTQYIRPICLPTRNTLSDTYVAAGWGLTNPRKGYNSRLNAVSLPYVAFEQCQQNYSARYTLRKGQMCAGGKSGQAACSGDSGGPLMKKQEHQGEFRWYVDGIDSLAYAICNEPGWPGIFTKVFDYMPWILSNLEL